MTSYQIHPSTIAEDTLLARARSGDADAFVELCGPVRSRALGVCWRILGDPDDAEDAFQSAVITAWETLTRFRGDSTWSTWLIGIARYTSFDMLRERQRHQRREQRLANLIATDPPRGFDVSVADRDAVARALHQVPEPFRTAVVLRELGELTYAEIADLENIPINTAKSRVSRARRALRRLLVASA